MLTGLYGVSWGEVRHDKLSILPFGNFGSTKLKDRRSIVRCGVYLYQALITLKT